MAEAARDAVDCLLFAHTGTDWLVPAALVAEVVPHFADKVPDGYRWRGLELACHGETGPVRALMVLRDLRADGAGFHALALAALPRPCRVGPAQLAADDDGALLLDGVPVRLYGLPLREDGVPEA